MLISMSLLVGCAKDDNYLLSINDRAVKISAKVDIPSDSRIAYFTDRYVMEIYEDSNCTKMVGSQQISTDGDFAEVILNSNKTYFLLFWADYDASSVYDVTSLKAVTLKDGENPVDAFSGKITISGKANNIDVILKRSVAKINFMENGLLNPGTIEARFTQPTIYNIATDKLSGANVRYELLNVNTKIDGTDNSVSLGGSRIYVLASSTFSDITFEFIYKESSKPIADEPIYIVGKVASNFKTNISGHYSKE